jgi:hypothetical protein
MAGHYDLEQLTRAAEQGDVWAQQSLGLACDRGNGVPEDVKKAAKWTAGVTDLFAKCPKCKAAAWSSNWSGVRRSTPAIICTALSTLSPRGGGASSSSLGPRFMARNKAVVKS